MKSLYKFDGKLVVEFCGDVEALEYASGEYGKVEKKVDGKWLVAADPASNPQHFYGKKNSGWMNGEKLVEFN